MRIRVFVAIIAGLSIVDCMPGTSRTASSGPSPNDRAPSNTAAIWATGSAVPQLPGVPVVPSTRPSTPANSPLLHPESPFWLQRAPDKFWVRIETTRGPFIMVLVRTWAPIGVDHFYNLVRAGYYDDSRFSRSNAGWIEQFGIARDSQLTVTWLSHPIKDDSVRAHNVRGTFSYAMRKPDDRSVEIAFNRREYRFFGGLTEVETAEALGVTSRTVEGDRVMARGWLFQELSDGRS